MGRYKDLEVKVEKKNVNAKDVADQYAEFLRKFGWEVVVKDNGDCFSYKSFCIFPEFLLNNDGLSTLTPSLNG